MSKFLTAENYLNYTFRNRALLHRALIHHSVNSNPEENCNHLEFIGNSYLYSAILQHCIKNSPTTLRSADLIRYVDQICTFLPAQLQVLNALSLVSHWQIEPEFGERKEEKHALILALAGALVLDGGYAAVSKLARRLMQPWSTIFPLVEVADPALPWGTWNYRKTIQLQAIEATFPNILSNRAYSLLPWALESHLRPGIYNQRSLQIFELGEAALRCIVDFNLYRHGQLEPSNQRYLKRESMLKYLGLGPRQDQVYASSFGGQDWRRQSLANRTQSLKNILGAVLMAEGEAALLKFSHFVLQKSSKIGILAKPRSIVVSHAA